MLKHLVKRAKAMHFCFKALLMVLLSFLWSGVAQANCLMFSNQNERLVNFCLLESVTGKLLDERTAVLVSQRLQREGYFGGLRSSSVTTSILPTLSYSSNINGGNPNKNLVVGELEFEGDPALVAEEGIVFGVSVGGSLRNTYGEGRYLDASLATALNWSPEYGTHYTTGRLAGCFKNKIKRSGYADFCFDGTEQIKDISSDRSKSISLNLGQLRFAQGFGFSDTSVGFKRNFHSGYQQNLVSLQWQTIHPKNVFASGRVRVGERVQNQMTLKYSLDVRLSKTFAGRPVTIDLGHKRIDGGKLLGVDRADTVARISVSMPLSKMLSLSAGYQETRSSIAYFESKEPSISLTLVW
ncbi:hypothetical protein OAI05_04140 [Planktomarina temperata]|nr:hypothetical protein [Planktomarina temperata]